MYEEMADIYDQVYLQRGKDYRVEADLVADLVLARCPGPERLLDIACGTGLHLERFKQRFDQVEGLEISEAMRDAARRRLPGTVVHHGDMRGFHLNRRFDAITCMFSSIGHMADEAELGAALESMAGHLRPAGVLVVEPWWFPETFTPGYVRGEVSTVDGRTVARVSHSERSGTASLMTVHFTVATAEGIRHFVDQHSISLFTREQYEAAFRNAGLEVEYLEEGPTDRGVFLGVPPAP